MSIAKLYVFFLYVICHFLVNNNLYKEDLDYLRSWIGFIDIRMSISI